MTPARLHGRGAAFAALAALLWGFVPVYIGLIGDVDTIEIVVHRALWSGVILLFLMLLLPKLTGGMAAVGDALRVPRLRWGFLASCAMLTINWMVFVHAVQSRQVIEAALGYFIYPLFTVVLGILFFRERLDRRAGSPSPLLLPAWRSRQPASAAFHGSPLSSPYPSGFTV